MSIAKNEALSIYRKRQKTVQFEDWDGVAADAASVSDYNELVALFTKLPESYRLALEMKYLLDYSGKEIADRLGISESAVNTRISRGRTLLREIAEKEGFFYLFRQLLWATCASTPSPFNSKAFRSFLKVDPFPFCRYPVWQIKSSVGFSIT